MGKVIYAADLFCGAGGTSTGMIQAAQELGLKLELLAVNHWARAVETHSRNHPWARHLCADLASVDPSKVIPGGRLNLLVASPECTHHSVARGGKPCSDQSRASAWHVLHWAERLAIENILIENVPEFQQWGPLTKAGKPMKRRRGDIFRTFLGALDSLGFTVDYRVLNAADYGDATSRPRLFIQARRGCAPVWPAATFAQEEKAGCARWRGAREIIDWSIRGRSIFGRKKPLSERTMRRIEAGLRKFGGEAFLTIARGPVNEPDRFARDVDAPVPVIVAGGTHIGLCEPFLVKYYRTGGAKSVAAPLDVQTAKARFGLVEPFVMPVTHHDDSDRMRSVEAPLPTITAAHRGDLALIQPVHSGCKLDILFRMLKPAELARAMGFEKYEFAGTQEECVRQIGNAVPVRLAKALCRTILAAG